MYVNVGHRGDLTFDQIQNSLIISCSLVFFIKISRVTLK